jgi:hypothetical protein
VQNSCFSPEEIALLTAVLDRVCADKHVVDESERTSIGKRIILKAQTGEWQFHALADYAARGGVIPQLQPDSKAGADKFAPHGFSMVDPLADEHP